MSVIYASFTQPLLSLSLTHVFSLASPPPCSNYPYVFPRTHISLTCSLTVSLRYPEAIPLLDKAHDMEPKNQQIVQALKFAEMKARKQAMERAKNRG